MRTPDTAPTRTWFITGASRGLDSIESSRALRVGGRLGRSMSAHCTSNGKAMLSTLSEAELLALYPDEDLSQCTTHSIGSRTGLLQALDEVRRAGYATSEEESEEGVASIGIALAVTPWGRLAVTASAPLSRMTPDTRPRVLSRIRAAVEEINKLLP
ncbi:IclR family transcriptional regulator [Nonomuraea insulae]|uniref:IclR family transcriptional regulator n=1 Tax=Nonomuraea insulae TaxID=1616787 RepID=A0ABW1CR58_9ACTN